MEPVSQSKQVLKMEVAVLKKLQSHSKHVCKYIDCGRNTSCNYMIMSLLGQSLADLSRSFFGKLLFSRTKIIIFLQYPRLRRANKSNSFSLSTSLRLTREMLLAIRDMHSAGYLHRDIKPSNFAIGQNSPRKIYAEITKKALTFLFQKLKFFINSC